MPEQRAWRKSTYSGVNENCLEVAELPGAVAVRDSKLPDCTHLSFSAGEWAAFLREVRETGL